MSRFINENCGGYGGRFTCDLCGASTQDAGCCVVSMKDGDAIQHICFTCNEVFDALVALRA